MNAADVVDALSRAFVEPALTGAPVVVGAPLGISRAFSALDAATDLDVLAHAMLTPRARLAAIARARRLACVDDDAGPLLDREAIVATLFLHEALAALHPEVATSVIRSGASRGILAGVAELLGALKPPTTLRALLGRDVVLGAITSRRCRRSEVRWWTGHARFVGQPVPPRLIAMPELRRVEETVHRVALVDLPSAYADGVRDACKPTFDAIVGAVLACSPLTELAIRAPRHQPLASAATLARFVATVDGANVVRRALERLAPEAAQRAGAEIVAASRHAS